MPPPVVNESATRGSPDASDLRLLFHRLNNQLGIILAHAELLEAKLASEQHRARATQVVTATLEAMSLTRQIRQKVDDN